ncbi:hypothetical protein M3P19_13690 [Muricauda sp. 2012CJ35-5]|uniref:Outer membrane protein beta-barrel domain-containing protein n=1 Tax=Flagellimonas spongiicola TaxID=2942208 RepID=A0ABT0PUL4_9FLAO|nr:hypothetical protein [Allomuricauda spongiicola]MCL6275067.1 hypothetical protein [Allomuricauda spongiicola]
MRIITIYLSAFLLLLITQQMTGQEDYKRQIEKLKDKKEQIAHEEKEALKEEVRDINDRMDNGDLSEDEAKLLKAEVAKKRALNIENRVAIIDNQIAILERNKGRGISILDGDTQFFEEDGFSIRIDGEPIFIGNHRRWEREVKYDRRTHSDLVVAFGLNNAIIEGESFNDSPYTLFGSKFFEIGYSWTTRVFKNTNWLRFRYGISFQFNGLKTNNQVFSVVQNPDILNSSSVVLTDVRSFTSSGSFKKVKLRKDSFIIPLFLEFGPSVRKDHGNYFRYSTRDQFKIGLGVFYGYNYKTIQKIKEGDAVVEDFEYLQSLYPLSNSVDTGDIGGISAYAGVGEMTLYFKYEINDLFFESFDQPNQNNISLGLRFDL